MSMSIEPTIVDIEDPFNKLNERNPTASLMDEIVQFTQFVALKKFENFEQQIRLAADMLEITQKVIALPQTEETFAVQSLWRSTLEQNHQRKIDRIGAPPITLDTTVSLELLKTRELSFTYEKVDLKDKKSFEIALGSLIELECELSKEMTFFPERMFRNLLNDSEQCFLQKINDKCVGILYGTASLNENPALLYSRSIFKSLNDGILFYENVEDQTKDQCISFFGKTPFPCPNACSTEENLAFDITKDRLDSAIKSEKNFFHKFVTQPERAFFYLHSLTNSSILELTYYETYAKITRFVYSYLYP